MHNQTIRATTQFDLRAAAHRYDDVIERVIGAASAQPPVHRKYSEPSVVMTVASSGDPGSRAQAIAAQNQA